jgi:hypothetical protein
MYIRREYFYCVAQVHGSVLHCGRCASCCEAHTSFVDEAAYIPCGDGVEYHHSSPASYNWATLLLGDMNTETWSSRLGVERRADEHAVSKNYCCEI